MFSYTNNSLKYSEFLSDTTLPKDIHTFGYILTCSVSGTFRVYIHHFHTDETSLSVWKHLHLFFFQHLFLKVQVLSTCTE